MRRTREATIGNRTQRERERKGEKGETNGQHKANRDIKGRMNNGYRFSQQLVPFSGWIVYLMCTQARIDME